MGRGEFKLAAQAGAKGYFGKVILEAEAADSGGVVTVDFNQTRASRWQSGARFGVDYVLEHVHKRDFFPKGGRVHVDCIEGHEVDTNNAVIAFVAANALLQALGVEPAKRPDLDKEKGLFIFPK